MYRIGKSVFIDRPVHVYTKLINNTKDEEFKKINIVLRGEEIPHLQFFQKKLGKEIYNIK